MKGTTVKSSWTRGGEIKATYSKTSQFSLYCCFMLAHEDVKEHGNDMLPGFETRSIPDEVVLETERFQFVN